LRYYVEDILTPAEAETLVGFNGKVPFDIGAIPKVVGEMERLGAAITPKSYCRIEGKSDGHDWHVDTGDSNHMPWCAWSASVLLTTPDRFEGGTFQFADPSEEHSAHYLDAIIYTSDERHRVLPHQGSRKVLLVFLGADNGE
jgi:hypothetical protein